MRFFDAHCHLIQDADAMNRAAAAGVERMACCGTRPEDWDEVLRLPEQFPQILPMIGLHPWFVSKEWKNDFQALEKMVRGFPATGIGETGLDFSTFAEAAADRQDRFTNRAEQEASFAAHLDLACELDRPVAVHCVRAWGRLMDILREHPAPRVLLHAFGGATELIPELVKLNCRFSFCGSVTNPQAARVRAAVAAVPADRLLIETDSPDFPPADCSFPNEPANIVQVARAVAELRGVSLDSLADLTFNNASSLFHTI